jgi:hypothetical protein
LNWKPIFFDDVEAKTVSKLVDKMLPRTDTPGALDVNVDVFMDKFFAEAFDSTDKEVVHEEIEAFNSTCISEYGDIFPNLNDEATKSVMMTQEAESANLNPRVWGTTVGEQEPISFYKKIKSIAIWAFFTSEKIGEKVLNYDPIPQRYEGCIPLADIGNRWSL